MSIPKEIQLHFRTINGALLAEVRDTKGEVWMAEALGEIRKWLDHLGFQWVVGSNGIWARGEAPIVGIVSGKGVRL